MRTEQKVAEEEAALGAAAPGGGCKTRRWPRNGERVMPNPGLKKKKNKAENHNVFHFFYHLKCSDFLGTAALKHTPAPAGNG
jgi:hypothetical protein